MNNHTINPVAQNNPSAPSAASAEANPPQPTEAYEQVFSVSDEDRIKVQSYLALALTEAPYNLGCRYLNEYKIFKKNIDSEPPKTIATLMSEAEAMSVQIFKDKAYQAIALKKHLDFYFRFLALDKISNPMKRLEVAIEVLKMSPKSCTLDGYYRILQNYLPEEWRTIASSPEIKKSFERPTQRCIPSDTEESYQEQRKDFFAKKNAEEQKTMSRSEEINPANPLWLNALGFEALRDFELNPYANQIELLSEEELEAALTNLDCCYHSLLKKDLCSNALSVFLEIAKGPYGRIDNVSSKILGLLRQIQQQSEFVPASILTQAPQIYNTLIKEGSFFPIMRLEILKTMGTCEEGRKLAEYLLLDPSSPVVIDLELFKSSTIEMRIAVNYLECIKFLQDDSTIDYLLQTIYKLPVFNHTQQFYSLLLKLKNSEIAKRLIQRTKNKETDPNCPESDAILERKHKALVTAQTWLDMGVEDCTNHGLRLPSFDEDHT